MISNLEVVLRLFLAVLLGGLVGLEREAKGRSAGFRTHILICVGSCLVMLTGIYMAAVWPDGARVDPTRIPAQVVSGIGLLGAGTIIQLSDHVKGLTTAAGVWTVAGIGLAVGCGFYVGAVAATGLVLIVLLVLHRLEQTVGVKAKYVGGSGTP